MNATLAQTFQQWTYTTWPAIGMILLSVGVIYVCLIVYTRFTGLRSFSKMSAFDFAMTVAIGSTFASTIVAKDPPLVQGIVALGGLYAGQIVIAMIRRRTGMSKILDNQPVLLMDGPTILHENLRRCRVTESDLRSKLREANVLNLSEVRAVVFETTGDVSVLHSNDPDRGFERETLLAGVRVGK